MAACDVEAKDFHSPLGGKGCVVGVPKKCGLGSLEVICGWHSQGHCWVNGSLWCCCMLVELEGAVSGSHWVGLTGCHQRRRCNSLGRWSQSVNCERDEDDERLVECVHEIFALDLGAKLIVAFATHL